MTRPFDCFVIFAEMRTGSNFLESNLDLFPGLQCYGEAFNPYFMVSPKTEDLFGATVSMRDADPLSLLERMKEQSEGLPGFRYFHDHDPRVFDALIDDPRCAKVVLTRNVVDAYVSRRIAMETDQWQLSDASDARKKKARFIPDEFEKQFYRTKAFQQKIKNGLQRAGQTAFYIDYEDAQNIDVINGLAKFLGETTEITEFAGTFKKQNPEPLFEKVQQVELLASTVGRIDVFDLQKLPNFEPSRPPFLKSYLASDTLQLVYVPVAGGPTEQISQWLESRGPLVRDFTQKSLRQWKRRHAAHRTFTVLRHPVARLHAVFCAILNAQEGGADWELKQVLRDRHDVAFPSDRNANWSQDQHCRAFMSFVSFVGENLAGRTSLRIDPRWASQTATIQGFAEFTLPDHILREDQLESGLANLCSEVGIDDRPDLPDAQSDTPYSLQQTYTDEIESAVRKTYQRDYVMFGFRAFGKA